MEYIIYIFILSVCFDAFTCVLIMYAGLLPVTTFTGEMDLSSSSAKLICFTDFQNSEYMHRSSDCVN